MKKLAPQACDPKELETTRIPNPGRDKEPQRPKLSGYEKEPVSKSERLGVQMNVSSGDFVIVSRGTRERKISREDIFAALAMGGLSPGEQNLAIYYYTRDPACRSAAWSWLMTHVSKSAIDWDHRKPGVLTALCYAVVDHLVDPRRNAITSDRHLARVLDLANHNSAKIWRSRYTALLEYAKQVMNKADRILERQL